MNYTFHICSPDCSSQCREKALLDSVNNLTCLGERLEAWYPPLQNRQRDLLANTVLEFYALHMLRGIDKFHSDALLYLQCLRNLSDTKTIKPGLV